MALSLPQIDGFSLLEVLMTVCIMGILIYAASNGLNVNTNASRYEITRRQLEILRTAMVGDSQPGLKHPSSFGFVGDWGSLPASLTALTNSQVPGWAFNNTYGIGAGWRGPYVTGFSTGDVTVDAWGRALSYSTAGTPTITSFGADGVAGGTGYDTDIVITMPSTAWQANVYGRVLNGVDSLANKTVEIRYPVNGVLTAFTVISDAEGDFTFLNVPFGVRAISVTSAPTLGTKQITVGFSTYHVPADVLNYFGTHP